MQIQLLLASLLVTLAHAFALGQDVQYAIAIHGGAGSAPATMSPEVRRGRQAALERVLAEGKKLLADGGASLDVVETVIRRLEDDPLFNAGRGAVWDSAGSVALDASIMDGRDKSCGAVGNVRTVRNPISLARKVMSQTRHVLLVSAGADEFALEMGLKPVDQDYFRTDLQEAAWRRWRAQRERAGDTRKQSGRNRGSEAEGFATVGCVAFDQRGNLAAGTSTGGLRGKKYGRVGDSPIIGAGTYADNKTCAVSCTGIGEQFIRHAIAYDVSAQLAYRRVSLDEAVTEVLTEKLNPRDGGIIAVDHQGHIVMQFTTQGMPRAAADSTGRFEVKLSR